MKNDVELRDYFAGIVLKELVRGLVSLVNEETNFEDQEGYDRYFDTIEKIYEALPERCYQIASNMVNERGNA